MLFYSRENGRDGEKDYLDTADFKDVYFEHDTFNCVSDRDEKVDVNYSLYYNELSNEIGLEGSIRINGETISRHVAIEEPYLLVEQGAQAYYDEKMLDDVEVIKSCKTRILNEIQSYLLESDYLLVGTKLDAMALLVNNGNTIAALDEITINSSTQITVGKFYSILELSTVNAGDITIYTTESKALVCKIDNITVNNNKLTIRLSSTERAQLESPFNYKKANSFKTREEYDEDRVQYISVGTTAEADFDEFDDLF